MVGQLDSNRAGTDLELAVALTTAELTALVTLHQSGLMHKLVQHHLVQTIAGRMRQSIKAGELHKAVLYEGQLEGLEYMLSWLEEKAKEWQKGNGRS